MGDTSTRKHSTSSDPHKEPEFDPRYFEKEIDLEMFSEAVKYTRKLADVSPLKDMIGTSYPLMPGAWADIVAWARSERDEPWA